MKGVLYLIPAPITEDVFSVQVYPMLEKIINKLDEFIVEDIKTARRSLRKMGFKKDFNKCIFHLLNEHSNKTEAEQFLASAENGKSIGLMSEAGMPAIADPGSDLVRRAHRRKIRVIPLYGPSSIFLALASSGLNGQHFCFHGYLPKSRNERRKKLKELELSVGLSNYTQIFIETPYRNNHIIEDILSVCSDEILLCVASGISWNNEKIITQRISDWKKNKFHDFNKTPAVFLLGR